MFRIGPQFVTCRLRICYRLVRPYPPTTTTTSRYNATSRRAGAIFRLLLRGSGRTCRVDMFTLPAIVPHTFESRRSHMYTSHMRTTFPNILVTLTAYNSTDDTVPICCYLTFLSNRRPATRPTSGELKRHALELALLNFAV